VSFSYLENGGMDEEISGNFFRRDAAAGGFLYGSRQFPARLFISGRTRRMISTRCAARLPAGSKETWWQWVRRCCWLP